MFFSNLGIKYTIANSKNNEIMNKYKNLKFAKQLEGYKQAAEI